MPGRNDDSFQRLCKNIIDNSSNMAKLEKILMVLYHHEKEEM